MLAAASSNREFWISRRMETWLSWRTVQPPQTTKGRFLKHMVEKSKPTPKGWGQFKIYLFQIWMMFITESCHNALYLQLALLELLIHFSNDRQNYALRFQIAGQVPKRPTMREWWYQEFRSTPDTRDIGDENTVDIDRKTKSTLDTYRTTMSGQSMECTSQSWQKPSVIFQSHLTPSFEPELSS